MTLNVLMEPWPVWLGSESEEISRDAPEKRGALPPAPGSAPPRLTAAPSLQTHLPREVGTVLPKEWAFRETEAPADITALVIGRGRSELRRSAPV